MAAILGISLHCARGPTLEAAIDAVERGESEVTGSLHVPAIGTSARIPYYDAGGIDLPAAAEVLEAARADSGLGRTEWARAALLLGSSSLSLPAHESEGSAPVYPEGGMRHAARALQARCAMQGPEFTINTACASSAHGLALARALVDGGRIAHAVVIGLEQRHRFTASGFAAMNLLSPAAMRPFDRGRDGLVLGEAASAIVLGPQRAGHPALLGGANRIDPMGESGADPGGLPLAEAIRDALAQARAAPDAIALVKAQAAGSRGNDAAEANALRAVFRRLPPVISLKPYLGHAMGAAGCAELALLLGAWRRGFVPGTPGYSDPDPELRCTPQTRAVPWEGGTAVLDFLGFGGGQAVLVVADAR